MKSWSHGLGKTEFLDKVVQPIQKFLIILITIIALDKLKFPVTPIHIAGFELTPNFTIHNTTLKELVYSIGVLVLIVSFFRFLLRVIDFIALILEKKADLTPDQSDDQLVIFFREFMRVIVVVIGILMALKFGFGLNISNLITGLSIVGAAMALATKESLENLIASFIIFFDKPFMVGDIVKVNQLTGVVEKIGLRSTRIRSEAKTTVTVPNKQMVDNMLDNQSLRTHRRVFSLIELATTSTHEQLNEVVTAVNFYLESRKDVESVFVFMEDFSRNAFVLHVEYFTNIIEIPAFYILRQSINLELIRIIEEKGVKMANPLGV
jgi:MscS family membrane protein